MRNEDPQTDSKIERLRARSAEGAAPRVAELVLIAWPAPDGPIYYATRVAADLLDKPELLDQLEGPIELRLGAGVFLEVPHDAGIADDTIDLDFWDGDDETTRLLLTHGAGLRVEVFYYFPDEDLLVSEWWGHLQPPSALTVDRVRVRAESGFRSSNLPLPKRAFFTGCQAVFGGLLQTQAEIDDNDCPYNRHLAGSVGAASSWTTNNLNGTPGAGGSYFKTAGGDAWNCGASHASPVTEGEAMIRATPAAGFTAFGFFTTDAPRSGNQDCFAVLQFNIAEHNTSIKYLSGGGQGTRANVAPWSTTDTFEIQLRDGAFHFYQNGNELAPDLVLPPVIYPLYLGVAVQTPGAGLSMSQVSVGEAGSAPGFGNLDADGQPFTDCPRNTPAVCIERLGDSLSYLAFDSVADSHVVHETKGPNITVTSRGNENNLKRPLRVIAGARHVSDLDLLAFVVEPDTKHPDEGSARCQYAVCEGPCQEVTNGKINGLTIGFEHRNYRTGERRQAVTSFSAKVLNYSGTAIFMGNVQGNFEGQGADALRGEVDVKGLRDVRIYTTETSYREEYSTERGWWLLHCLRNKRWGYGLDVARISIPDFINLGQWFKEIVAQKDKDGNDTNGPRSQFQAELVDRSAQQQITDICLSGRIGLPFPDRGLLRVTPLRRALGLFSPAVFTDQAYWGAFNREASPAELADWLAALEAARVDSPAALLTECRARLEGLFHAAEYAARARTDEEFVSDVYRAYLRREGEPEGIAFWLGQIPVGGRDGILEAFGNSPEFIKACSDVDATFFTDAGEERNICLDQAQSEGGKSTLVFSMQSDAELCNRVVLTFDDETQQNVQIPLSFEDVGQQLRAGRAFGDTSRRVVEKQYSAFGITSIGEAGRLGNLLLDLGEFDEGGLKNNLRATFTTWYLAAVRLSKYQIIRIESAKLDQINNARQVQGLEPFIYFRIRSLVRQADLKVEISAQAYPASYYDRLELLTRGPDLAPNFPGDDGGFAPGDPAGPGRGRLPYAVGLDAVAHTNDQLTFTIGTEAL